MHIAFPGPSRDASSTRPLVLAHGGSKVQWPVLAPLERFATTQRRALAETHQRALLDALVDDRRPGRGDAGAPAAEQRTAPARDALAILVDEAHEWEQVAHPVKAVRGRRQQLAHGIGLGRLAQALEVDRQ